MVCRVLCRGRCLQGLPVRGILSETHRYLRGVLYSSTQELDLLRLDHRDFSSSVSELFPEGLPEFIENGGTIRLLPGVVLYEEDIEAIDQGHSDEVFSKRIEWEKVEEGSREEEFFAGIDDRLMSRLHGSERICSDRYTSTNSSTFCRNERSMHWFQMPLKSRRSKSFADAASGS